MTKSRSIGAALLALTRCGQVEAETVRSWRSITFSGCRHHVRLRFDGVEEAIMGEALIEELSDTETFNLAGQQVVDLCVASIERQSRPLRLIVEFSVLTLDLPEREAA